MFLLKLCMCSLGHFSSTPGSGSCSLCLAGKNCSSALNGNTLIDCPEGYYSQDGDRECRNCASGRNWRMIAKRNILILFMHV